MGTFEYWGVRSVSLRFVFPQYPILNSQLKNSTDVMSDSYLSILQTPKLYSKLIRNVNPNVLIKYLHLESHLIIIIEHQHVPESQSSEQVEHLRQ